MLYVKNYRILIIEIKKIEYKKKNEIMPKFDEMKEHMNVKSKSVVFNMLGYIEWKGYIKRHPAHARAIEILKEVA